jgi:hypothetical protein
MLFSSIFLSDSSIYSDKLGGKLIIEAKDFILFPNLVEKIDKLDKNEKQKKLFKPAKMYVNFFIETDLALII